MSRHPVVYSIILVMIVSTVLFSGCRRNKPASYRQTALTFTEALIERRYADAYQLFSPAVKNQVSLGNWSIVWDRLLLPAGSFTGTGEVDEFEEQGYSVVVYTVSFSGMSILQRTVFNDNGEIEGVFFTPLENRSADDEEYALPDGLIEEEISFDSQPGYPIHGTLTRPKEDIKASVILMHGSGSLDRDETIGPNKPFRDIAHGLAQNGIAVLRYDKGIYTYGPQIASGADFVNFTVDQEVAFDAVNALKWLQAQEGIDPDTIFLLGHSLSGGLLAYTDAMVDSGPAAVGYIILAGSPRKVWEVLQDQYRPYMEGTDTEAEEIAAIMEAELAKVARLPEMTPKEIREEMVFGMPAHYMMHLDSIDPIALHLADGKPLLVLYGAKDRQVFNTDFDLWKKGFMDHPDTELQLYKDLNHLFGHYQGEEVDVIYMNEIEYGQRTPVPAYVIEDIGDWILRKSLIRF